MNYIIANPDMQSGIELKKILSSYGIFECQGIYTTLSEAKNYSFKHPPDIIFIFLQKVELDAFSLAAKIHEQNPLTKVVFISNQRENAVEAFEYEADGFLLVPFDKNKIGKWLQQNIGKRNKSIRK